MADTPLKDGAGSGDLGPRGRARREADTRGHPQHTAQSLGGVSVLRARTASLAAPGRGGRLGKLSGCLGARDPEPRACSASSLQSWGRRGPPGAHHQQGSWTPGLLAPTGSAPLSPASSQQGRVLTLSAGEAAVLGQPGLHTCAQISCEGTPAVPPAGLSKASQLGWFWDHQQWGPRS